MKNSTKDTGMYENLAKDAMKLFERDFRNRNHEKENCDKWDYGKFYFDVDSNKLFNAFFRGYLVGKGLV